MTDSRQYRDDSLASDDRRPPARRGPAPVTLIISVLLLLGVAGGVAYLYRDGVRGSDGPPRPVGAPLRDVRTVAPPSPQAADPAAGLSIYKDDPNTAAAPTFAPPPEEPVARVAETPPAVAPTPPAPAKAMTIDKLIAQADAKPADADDTPKPPVKAIVQIGAFSTEDLAKAAFHDAARIGGGKMSGKAMRLVPIEKGDVTLYRVAATGFTSKDDAEAVCDALKAAGKSCFVR
jgi:cell division septation protein DedD